MFSGDDVFQVGPYRGALGYGRVTSLGHEQVGANFLNPSEAPLSADGRNALAKPARSSGAADVDPRVDPPGADLTGDDSIVNVPEGAQTGDDSTGEHRRERLGRSALIITICNLASRVTGFVRVIAIASALGIAYLGDAYQRANEVSNVLFELLAGGLLFSVLVPSFVELLTKGDHERAKRLGGVLVGRGIVVVGAVAALGMVFAEPIMRALTVGVSGPSRAAQVELGVFLLWFIMPQLVFYAIGSVANAMLQADHRFVAATIAPVFNNVIVTVTMVIFAIEHDSSRGFALTVYEKWLLGGGTLAGTIAMTALPLIALWRCGMPLVPRWKVGGLNLRPLLFRGMWGAGHVGLNEILIGTTIVLSGQVNGGVIAYQTAFTFFLLPHALLAHPIFTALFPRLSRRATAGDTAEFSDDLGFGSRMMLVLLLPASGIMAVIAAPALSLVQIGALDARGARLVALVLASYLVGLAGYSSFFLLTRASYALANAKRPTVVNAGVTAVAVVAMLVATSLIDGTALLISFGIIQSVTISVGSMVLHVQVARSIQQKIPVAGTVVRALVGSVLASGAAYVAMSLVGWDSRVRALFAAGAGAATGGVVYLAFMAALKNPELALMARKGLAFRTSLARGRSL